MLESYCVCLIGRVVNIYTYTVNLSSFIIQNVDFSSYFKYTTLV